MKYQTLCVVNPCAGNKRGKKRWQKVEASLREAGIKVDVTFTKHPFDAASITREALTGGYNRILAAGGDGTLNEVVNGFFNEEGVINPQACLAVVPIGTGGDFARLYNLRNDGSFLVQLLSANHLQACDIVKATYTDWEGRRSSRYYINIADSGIGSETVYRVNHNSKALGGFWSFLLAALSSIASYKNRYLAASIDGEEVFEGRSSLITITNGQYFGGGVRIAPHASTNDGLLDIVIAKDFGKLELFSIMPSAYRGNHLNHAKVQFHRGRRVTVKSSEDMYLEIDGESVGRGDFEFEILPSALQLVTQPPV